MPSTPTRDQLISLARAAAAAHSLDPALVCAVCEQESAWNPWAIRYEPGFLARYVAPLFTAGKISATEAYARSFSWGLMQVMGQVAREHDFTGASVAQLCDPATGLDVGCQVLAHKFASAGATKSADDASAHSPIICPKCGAVQDGIVGAPRAVPACGFSPDIISRALQLWNGGANPDYAAQVLARVKNYL